MIPASWFWSHLSLALLVAALLVGATAKVSKNRRAIALVALAVGMLLSIVPLGEVDLAGYLLALSGELSFATLFYLTVYLFWHGSERLLHRPGQVAVWVGARNWNSLRWVWVVAGLVLYASALSGRGPDVYAWGFGSALVGLGLALSAGLAVTRRWLEAVLLLGIIWAWQLRLSGGGNFWDYAIDPFIFASSLAQVLWALVRRAWAVGGIGRGGERKLSVTAVDGVAAAVP